MGTDYYYYWDRLGDGDGDGEGDDELLEEMPQWGYPYDGSANGQLGDRRLAVSCDITLALYDG